MRKYDYIERCVYALLDPRENINIAYIGQSINPKKRYKQHIADGIKDIEDCKNVQKKEWIRELTKLGLEPVLVILERLFGSQFMVFDTEMRRTIEFRDMGYKILSIREEKINSL